MGTISVTSQPLAIMLTSIQINDMKSTLLFNDYVGETFLIFLLHKI